MRSNDPLADFNYWDAEQERRLAGRPVCKDCGEPIQEDSAFYMDGRWICEACMEDYRRYI
jgi:formylmethanofuran dehydrogenase subunit E